jgi:Flp pilus assembly protein TadG
MPFMAHLMRTWRHGRQILREARGQALVEFALVLPVLVLLVFGVLKLGIAATSWSDETHLANEAARFAVVNSCPGCAPGQKLNDWILTQADTGDLKTNGTLAITFDPTVLTKNHCAGKSVQVKVSYIYTLVNLPILPSFTTPITATSTQRLETDYKGDGTDRYTATGYTTITPGVIDPC